MKKITGIFFAFLTLKCVYYSLYASSIAGFNMTGAPSEGNCSSCHIGNTNPDKQGSITILINGENNHSTFMPDSIYNIEVISTNPGTSKFGFAVNARFKGISFNNAGTFINIGDSGVSVSDYVTHNQYGNTGLNTKKWRFKWQAPKNPENESITFYAAGVMANNDNNTQGDKVYLDSINLQQLKTSLKEEAWKQNIFLRQTESALTLTSPFDLKSLKLYNIQGTEITYSITEAGKGNYLIYPISAQNCIIIVSVQTNLGWWTTKVLF